MMYLHVKYQCILCIITVFSMVSECNAAQASLSSPSEISYETFTVPLDYDDPSAGTMNIAYRIFPATVDEPQKLGTLWFNLLATFIIKKHHRQGDYNKNSAHRKQNIKYRSH